jgi:hypothetical protein
MYPGPLKLNTSGDATICKSGEEPLHLELAVVELWPYVGEGIQVSFVGGGELTQIALKPDDAQSLAEALTLYVNAAKRIAARTPAEVTSTWTPEWSGHGDC